MRQAVKLLPNTLLQARLQKQAAIIKDKYQNIVEAKIKNIALIRDIFGGTKMNNFDARQVYQFWDVFKGGNQLTEIRLIASDGKTASGYFTDPNVMIEAVKPYINDYSVYFTINSINPDCYGRPQRDKIMPRVKNTTTDGEIICRDWVLLDLDSRRATGVNATEEQLSYAKKKANEVYKFLRDNGFYEPVVICSGSGVHLYLRCALLPSEENNALIKRFTQAMSMLFSDEQVDIDEKVFNLGRIARVCGYYNRKGTNADKERPQRLCEFVRVPSEIKITEREYFEKIAALYPEDVKPSRENNYSTEKFDLESFLDKHGIKVTKIEQVAGGKKYVLDHCVFNESHRGKDAVIFQRDNGAISYVCLHNSCSHYSWRDVRLMFEPDAYDRKDYKEFQAKQRRYSPNVEPFVPQEECEEKGKKWLQMSEIKKVNIEDLLCIPTGYDQLDNKIVGLFAGELTILSGANSSGKCSWLDCLALNAVHKGFKVGVWSGEMQDWRFQNWIMQIAAGKTYSKRKIGFDNLYYVPSQYTEKIASWLNDKLFLYNNNYGNNFKQIFSDIRDLVEREKVQMVIIDNLAALDIDSYDGEKYSKQTKFIIELKEYAKAKNIHIIVVCHPRKQITFLRKDSISGTADLTNIADNVFILHRVGKDFEDRASEFLGSAKALELCSFSNIIEVAKNRQFGVVDYFVGLFYEPESRRLKNSVAEHIIYGWEEVGVQSEIEYSETPSSTTLSTLSEINDTIGDFDDDLPY